MIDEIIKEMQQWQVPEYLSEMLEIEKKSELDKYCRKIVIYQKDFVKLIHCSQTIGYIHQIKSNDFVPSHLNPTDMERNALSSCKAGETLEGDARKYFSKISQIFEKRRLLVAHIFYNKKKWHLFYFDQRDIEEMKGNHWKEGTHIHFVNYLWPQHSINELWKIFDEASAKVSSKLHIRYIPQKRYASED